MKLLSPNQNIDNPTSEEMTSVLCGLGSETKRFVILLNVEENEMLQVIYAQERFVFRYQNDRNRIMESTVEPPALSDVIEPMQKYLAGDIDWRCNLAFKKECFPGIRGFVEKMIDRYVKKS